MQPGKLYIARYTWLVFSSHAAAVYAQVGQHAPTVFRVFSDQKHGAWIVARHSAFWAKFAKCTMSVLAPDDMFVLLEECKESVTTGSSVCKILSSEGVVGWIVYKKLDELALVLVEGQ